MKVIQPVQESNEERHCLMQEILAKPGDENLPFSEHEFYELCIEDSDDIWRSHIRIAYWGPMHEVRLDFVTLVSRQDESISE